jgi:hypothetical protein
MCAIMKAASCALRTRLLLWWALVNSVPSRDGRRHPAGASGMAGFMQSAGEPGQIMGLGCRIYPARVAHVMKLPPARPDETVAALAAAVTRTRTEPKPGH